MKSWTPPTLAMLEKVLTSVKKETDRQYFFSRLQNPLWVEPLRERGYFNNPPGVKYLPDGYVQYPYWPELRYLVVIAEEAPEKVLEILLSLPRTDNPVVYDDVFAIALKLKGRESSRLLPKIIEGVELDNTVLSHRHPALLRHWVEQGNIAEAFEVVRLLVFFREDLKKHDKQKLRKKGAAGIETMLEPAPRFRQWEYQQILDDGVRPLVEHVPYPAACLLIDAVESMIRLGVHREDFEKRNGQDYSEIWCRRLSSPDADYQDAKEALVQTLTYACEQVYGNALEYIGSLDQELRKHRWMVFKRLRQHLYALHPSEQTRPWIREQILAHKDYCKWEHHYEFQAMIRKAIEFFGPSLLDEDERKAIFDAILEGPSENDFREWLGEQYSEEAFQQRQRHFHRKQLRPFAELLGGQAKRYFDELEGAAQAEVVTDDSYSPYGGVTSGFVSYRSPKSVEDLESLADEALLTYLNDWDEERRDKDNWLVEIKISALADVFQTLFKEKIVVTGERLAFWLANRERITRPIYVAAMLRGMIELLKGKNFDQLNQWIEFSAWALLHPDVARVEGQPEPRSESRDYPDWGSARQVVIDLIDVCVSKDVDVPITAREGLGTLLKQACSQFDWQLDHGHPVLLNRDDPITEAINNTRSRALETLVNFGFWIRRQSSEDRLAELFDILDIRMAKESEIPLTRPEYALLGMHFGNLCILNQEWASRRRELFFPQANVAAWRDIFGSYIRFNNPAIQVFEVLRGDFKYAIENLNVLAVERGDGKKLADKLGQHLFTYYLWGVYPLTGDESLLECFYEKTKDDRERWGQLFDHVGRSLQNSGSQLDKALVVRAVAFFDWRFEAAEPVELQEFTFWLEAECLDSAWRLQSYLKILDLGQGEGLGLSRRVRALNKLLSNHLVLVVECFAKITGSLGQGSHLYISAEAAKPILKAGLASELPQVVEHAERARENLLRLGQFDYLNVE